MQQSQQTALAPRRARRTWRTFPLTARRAIDDMLGDDSATTCPLCGEWLEARPRTRIHSVLRSAARSCDLECRPCRRFHPVLRDDVLYRYRVRRIAVAVMRA
jgi:hypothetical protein